MSELKARELRDKVEDDISAAVTAIVKKFKDDTGFIITTVQVSVMTHHSHGDQYADHSIVTGAKIEFE